MQQDGRDRAVLGAQPLVETVRIGLGLRAVQPGRTAGTQGVGRALRRRGGEGVGARVFGGVGHCGSVETVVRE